MRKLLLNASLTAILVAGCSTIFAAESNGKMMDSNAMLPEAISVTPVPMTGNKKSHLFEERAGTWKATCDRMEDNKVYCRMFHIEQFGEWKAKNFVQIGPAWSPNAVGFVIATYLGFKEGTTVTLGIDKHERHEFTAPRGNNLMTSPEVAKKILEQMENGSKVVIYFNSYSGVQQLSLADLG
ncbi:MAG: hypothetical protein HKP55_03150, partial [Gammaproteobacteria bacterium]|nr:hypothetical protein [Gammaproteobacteria bacterium]